jgi:hypothetical protein
MHNNSRYMRRRIHAQSFTVYAWPPTAPSPRRRERDSRSIEHMALIKNMQTALSSSLNLLIAERRNPAGQLVLLPVGMGGGLEAPR